MYCLSGVFEGVTTGTSIGLLIENTDQRSGDYSEIAKKFRPGHADYTYQQKYGIRDYRGGGRSSARETAMRVAAGGIAKKYLRAKLGAEIRGYLAQLGPIELQLQDWGAVEQNPFFCPQPDKVAELEAYMDALRKEGWAVDVAEDGVKGAASFEQHQHDLVLTDLVMPRLGGIELLKRIKALSPDTTVVIITAHGTVDRAVEAMREGATDFIAKPFRISEIREVVKKAKKRVRKSRAKNPA